MRFSAEYEGGFVGEFTNRFRVVRRCKELTAPIGHLPQAGDELADFGQRKMVVWLVPHTKNRRTRRVGGDDVSAEEEALLAVGQRLELDRDL